MMQQTTFMEDKALPYEQTILLLVKSKINETEKLNQIFYYIESVKIHSLLMSENRTNNFPENIASLEEIKKCLSGDEVMIDFYYGADYLIALLVSNTGAKLEINNRGANDITPILERYSKNMSPKMMEYKGSYCTQQNIINEGSKLFSLLFGSHYSNGRLPQNCKIFVIPHRQLHYLPWNSLSLSKQNNGMEYLIDKYQVSVIPAAMVLYRMKKEKNLKHKTKKLHNTFSIGSNISYRNDTLKALRGLNSWNIYEGKKVNVENALAELQKSDIVIFYAHGYFDQTSPFDSYKELNDETENSKLTLMDIESTSISCDFIVLAGCATGTIGKYSELSLQSQEEKFPEADDLLGIYKQLVSKGVRNIIVSVVNETNKTCTENMLISLACKLNDPSYIASEAFRNSILEAKGNKKHPYYWGAYVLVGAFKILQNYHFIYYRARHFFSDRRMHSCSSGCTREVRRTRYNRKT